MGHWANSRAFKEARRRRDAATVLAMRSRLSVALLAEGPQVPGGAVWDALTRVHESRGIYRLLVSERASRWGELKDWSGWWNVVNAPCDARELVSVRPGGVVAFDCSDVLLERLRNAGLKIWVPAAPG